MSQEVWDLERFAARATGEVELPRIPEQVSYEHTPPSQVPSQVREAAVDVQLQAQVKQRPSLLVQVLTGAAAYSAGLALAAALAGGMG